MELSLKLMSIGNLLMISFTVSQSPSIHASTNFFFISICKTKGGLLISNHSPCYDDLSDSVITSPLRLALTTWLDTSRGPHIHKHLALKKVNQGHLKE